MVLGGKRFLMSEVTLHTTTFFGSFRSLRFLELPIYAGTKNYCVERPCFLSDHIRQGRTLRATMSVVPGSSMLMPWFTLPEACAAYRSDTVDVVSC